MHRVHLDFLSIPVYDPEPVLLVETLEHGQRDLPVDLKSSGHGILVVIKSADSPSAQVPRKLNLGAVKQECDRRRVQANPGLEALDLKDARY